MSDIEALFSRFLASSLEIAQVNGAKSLLEWDLETGMPPKGGDARARMIGALSAIVHERLTAPAFVDVVSELMGALDALDERRAAAVRLTWRRLERERKLPKPFVEECSTLTAASHQVWVDARARKEFAFFRPQLERIVEMKRREASYVGYVGSPYDALLDEFEPGMTTVRVADTLRDLRAFLAPFVGTIMASPCKPDPAFARIPGPRRAQEELNALVARAIGFDLDAGRIDPSAHPFCATVHPGDVRLTTRYDDDALFSLFSVIHEAGHGMYEQGLPADLYGTPAGEAPSMGMHESQSRLWENLVGKGLPFWQWLGVVLRDARLLGDGVADADRYWRAANVVRPSFIRTEADEVTYNLHVCLRFEIERALIEGDLEVAGAADAWNRLTEECLGLVVPSDDLGALQDVHWSAGLFGYFPTYAIGNIYSAQLFASAEGALSGLGDDIANGRFSRLLGWLREHVHRHGSVYPADEIVRRATGSGLDAGPFKNYLARKYREIYAL